MGQATRSHQGCLYEWDREGRLTGVTPEYYTGVSYNYDALGRRMSKTLGGSTPGQRKTGPGLRNYVTFLSGAT